MCTVTRVFFCRGTSPTCLRVLDFVPPPHFLQWPSGDVPPWFPSSGSRLFSCRSESRKQGTSKTNVYVTISNKTNRKQKNGCVSSLLRTWINVTHRLAVSSTLRTLRGCVTRVLISSGRKPTRLPIRSSAVLNADPSFKSNNSFRYGCYTKSLESLYSLCETTGKKIEVNITKMEGTKKEGKWQMQIQEHTNIWPRLL